MRRLSLVPLTFVVGMLAACEGSKPAGIPALHTEGRFFKDDAGKTVILRGVSFADLKELDTARAPMNIAKLLDLVSDESQGWYARVVRLVVYPEDWRPDPEGYFEKYLKPAVEHAASRRLYAIVDWHEIGDAAPADAETRQFWAKAAPAFASYPNVIYELFNEAEDMADTSWATWKSHAQPWIDQIRRDAPHNIILIGAPFWTQAIAGAATDPFAGNNLAYVGHIYPGIDRGVWGPTGAFTQVAATRPMMITEWGYRATGVSPTTGTQNSFGDDLKAYIEAQGVGWTAWCADTLWDSTMFDASWKLLTGPSEMGGFTKDWLAEKKWFDLPTNLFPGKRFDASASDVAGDVASDAGSYADASIGQDATVELPDGMGVVTSTCSAHSDEQMCAEEPGCVWLRANSKPLIKADGCYPMVP